jgi:hypothetical protein
MARKETPRARLRRLALREVRSFETPTHQLNAENAEFRAVLMFLHGYDCRRRDARRGRR